MRGIGVFCILLFTVGLVGCGGNPATVKGKVTLDGNPVTAGQITFVPDSSKGSEGPQLIGTIDESGEYALYAGADDRVPVGHYKVTVNCPFRLDQGSSGSGEGPEKENNKDCDIPSKYGDVASTDLTAEVVSGAQEIPIELKSK